MNTKSPQLISSRIENVPKKPGVYILKSKQKIIYIGKSTRLRDRLKTYFLQKKFKHQKEKNLNKYIDDFEYLVTETEQEALLLENTLIKEYKPMFNIRLKDDKSYPYIKINTQENFPKVYLTRNIVRDGSRYFGPYANVNSVRKTLNIINKLFPYRSCTKEITGKDPRPCLEFYIKRCIAPCSGESNKEEYQNIIQQVIKFLEGDFNEVVKNLNVLMWNSSNNLDFEKATILREKINSIKNIYQKQKVVSEKNHNTDIITLTNIQTENWIGIFHIRKGNLIGRDHFLLEKIDSLNNSTPELISRFIEQYYLYSPYIPDEIITLNPINSHKKISRWLSSKNQKKVIISNPQKGSKKKLLEMALYNEEEWAKQQKIKNEVKKTFISMGLSGLKESFNLPKLPKIIECYDISHIQGSNVVGSLVVFENGKPKKSLYRKFNIKSFQGNDDYAALKEVIKRRIKHINQDKLNPLKYTPDLILIDGGKGQLNSVQEELLYSGFNKLNIASIAKKNELIFLPGIFEPIKLEDNSPQLFLIQQIRDEAHRFAVNFHRTKRSDKSLKSELDDIEGLGPKRKKALINRFGSINAIKEADLKSIQLTPGLPKQVALRIKEYF
ncbi:MAG: excinuclease ABC subunit UvrC [Dehalococcoidia bacterium]|jgi:excinuclease ABC subunit C|nr:excinuclease ABC subunit UvrC [Dehalococcoidia bacterium]